MEKYPRPLLLQEEARGLRLLPLTKWKCPWLQWVWILPLVPGLDAWAFWLRRRTRTWSRFDGPWRGLLSRFEDSVGKFDYVALVNQPMQIAAHGSHFRSRSVDVRVGRLSRSRIACCLFRWFWSQSVEQPAPSALRSGIN